MGESLARIWLITLERCYVGAPDQKRSEHPAGVSPVCRVSGYRRAECLAPDIPGDERIEALRQSIPRSFPSPPSPSGHPPLGPTDLESDIDSSIRVPE